MTEGRPKGASTGRLLLDQLRLAGLARQLIQPGDNGQAGHGVPAWRWLPLGGE